MTEYIKCPLCGKDVKRLKKHLRMAKEHKNLDVDLYLKEHPELKTVSDAERLRYVDAQKQYCNSEKGHEQMVRMANVSWENPKSREKLMEGRKRQHESQEFKELHRQIMSKTAYRLMSNKEFFSSIPSYKTSYGKWSQYTTKFGKVINARSKIELEIAKCLDDFNLYFTYEEEAIPYTDVNGNPHTYYLDFYVPSLDLAIEGKIDSAWKLEDTQIKFALTKSKYKYSILVGKDLSELKQIIESSTTTENIV